jgi:hypothetical protein
VKTHPRLKLECTVDVEDFFVEFGLLPDNGCMHRGVFLDAMEGGQLDVLCIPPDSTIFPAHKVGSAAICFFNQENLAAV